VRPVSPTAGPGRIADRTPPSGTWTVVEGVARRPVEGGDPVTPRDRSAVVPPGTDRAAGGGEPVTLLPLVSLSEEGHPGPTPAGKCAEGMNRHWPDGRRLRGQRLPGRHPASRTARASGSCPTGSTRPCRPAHGLAKSISSPGFWA